nr:hypothetical protein [Tanacetum cinerariifolium]
MIRSSTKELNTPLKTQKEYIAQKGGFSRHLEVILFYNGLDVPTRQILDSKGVIPTKIVADAKITIQEMDEYCQKWHNKTSLKSKSTTTSSGLAAIQAQLNNLGREIKKVNKKVYVAQVGWELCKGPHYTKDCPLKEEGILLKRLITYSLEYSINLEGSIEQQGQDSTNDNDDHKRKSPDGALMDIPVFVGKFSILTGFIIIDDEDVTSDVALGMKHMAYHWVWDTAY